MRFANTEIPPARLLQLNSLDMEVVSEESKAFANTVFLKKSMYYNMRSRIVKRHAGHVIRKVRHYRIRLLFSACVTWKHHPQGS